jgi:hypothetical protein
MQNGDNKSMVKGAKCGCLMSIKFQLCKNENILEICFTKIQIHLTLLNYTIHLKMVKMAESDGTHL